MGGVPGYGLFFYDGSVVSACVGSADDGVVVDDDNFDFVVVATHLRPLYSCLAAKKTHPKMMMSMPRIPAAM